MKCEKCGKTLPANWPGIWCKECQSNLAHKIGEVLRGPIDRESAIERER